MFCLSLAYDHTFIPLVLTRMFSVYRVMLLEASGRFQPV